MSLYQTVNDIKHELDIPHKNVFCLFSKFFKPYWRLLTAELHFSVLTVENNTDLTRLFLSEDIDE